jgi:hypothetical protein
MSDNVDRLSGPSPRSPACRRSADRGAGRRLQRQSRRAGPRSHLRWNDPKSELPVLIVTNFRGVSSLPCGATIAHPSCYRFRRYRMTVVVFHPDNPHVSLLERTPPEKPGHDVLALPGSAFVEVPGVLPNFQPLFECEFERNAAAFGAKLVVVVVLFPFAHVEWYWLRMVLTRCRRASCVRPADGASGAVWYPEPSGTWHRRTGVRGAGMVRQFACYVRWPGVICNEAVRRSRRSCSALSLGRRRIAPLVVRPARPGLGAIFGPIALVAVALLQPQEAVPEAR